MVFTWGWVIDDVRVCSGQLGVPKVTESAPDADVIHALRVTPSAPCAEMRPKLLAEPAPRRIPAPRV